MEKGNEIETITLQEWGADIFPKLSWFKQEKVSSAHIMVVGCGALGNEVLKNLALFGVGNLVLVDLAILLVLFFSVAMMLQKIATRWTLLRRV